MSATKPNYDDLTPDLVIDAVESQGFLSDARIIALNSYENRVYQVGIDQAEPVIAKFYRPQRWSNEQIQEEHNFSWALAESEIPIIAPIRNADGETLFEYGGYRFSLFPRRGGQSPEPGDLDQLYRLGTLLGRIHMVGAAKAFEFRDSLTVDAYGHTPTQFLLENDFISSNLQQRFTQASEQLLKWIQAALETCNKLTFLRSHGDCHLGNILWHRDLGPAFVDMDDCISAPAVQDFWMLLEGNHGEQSLQISELLAGYSEFKEFNGAELSLVEPLRALRMMHYSGWLAKRWNDPAFPLHFPWFNTEQYWMQHVGALEEQLTKMDQAPPRWY